jgi:beta-carotene ketolase (CrtW type)
LPSYSSTLLYSNTSEPSLKEKVSFSPASSNYGLPIAIAVIGLWAISLTSFLSIDVAKMPSWTIPLAMLWQMFLYTGLFITAHDAMHGSILPGHPKANSFVGRLAVLAYGLFSYRELLQKHWLHHRYPASDRDPDFHDGVNTHPVAWYLHFFKGYWGWQQFIGFSVLWYFATMVSKIPVQNLILFWILPLILSSIQLFYFGTFMTHRRPEGGHTNHHRAQTNAFPVFWSFITCYHFGYHEEHHELPSVPWWQLPKVHRSWVDSQIDRFQSDVG